MTRGGKKDKKKNNPDTPESSTTQSSVPSVDDEESELLPTGARASNSTRKPRSRKKKKSAASGSSTPQSSVPSVEDEAAQLLPSSRNAPEFSPEKSRLSVPDQGAIGSRSPSKSPSKSPSTLSRWKISLERFSPKSRSPKRSIVSESPSESTSSQNTDCHELKPETGAIRKTSNKSKSSSSNVSKVSSDDVPQSENRLNVPERERIESNPKSPKKGFFGQTKNLLPKSPDGRKNKAESKDTSPKSSSKSATSSSSVSPISKKRQESEASNISSENSHKSSSKSPSISGANNKESLYPDMGHQFLKCSPRKQNRNDSFEGSSSDSAGHACNDGERSTDEYFKFMLKNLIDIRYAPKSPSQAEDLEKRDLVLDRVDNLYFGEKEMDLENKPRQRSRSHKGHFFIKPSWFRKFSSKARQKNDGDHDTKKGAVAACSGPAIGGGQPGIGADEINAVGGATAPTVDQFLKRVKNKTQSGVKAPQSSRLFQGDRAARHDLPVTRHASLSPKCRHRILHGPKCSTVRTLRNRRNRKKFKQPKHINETVKEVGSQSSAIRENLSRLRAVREKLLTLEKGVEKALNIGLSSVEVVGDDLLRLEVVRNDLLTMQQEINEVIDNLRPSRIREIKEKFLSQDDEVATILNNIVPSRLEASGSSFVSLEAAKVNLSRLEEEIEELKNNVGFSRLEKFPEILSRIEENLREIKENPKFSRIEKVKNLVSTMKYDLHFILKKNWQLKET